MLSQGAAALKFPNIDAARMPGAPHLPADSASSDTALPPCDNEQKTTEGSRNGSVHGAAAAEVVLIPTVNLTPEGITATAAGQGGPGSQGTLRTTASSADAVSGNSPEAGQKSQKLCDRALHPSPYSSGKPPPAAPSPMPPVTGGGQILESSTNSPTPAQCSLNVALEFSVACGSPPVLPGSMPVAEALHSPTDATQSPAISLTHRAQDADLHDLTPSPEKATGRGPPHLESHPIELSPSGSAWLDGKASSGTPGTGSTVTPRSSSPRGRRNSLKPVDLKLGRGGEAEGSPEEVSSRVAVRGAASNTIGKNATGLSDGEEVDTEPEDNRPTPPERGTLASRSGSRIPVPPIAVRTTTTSSPFSYRPASRVNALPASPSFSPKVSGSPHASPTPPPEHKTPGSSGRQAGGTTKASKLGSGSMTRKKGRNGK